MMLFAAFGVLALIVVVPLITRFIDRKKYLAHEARRHERQRVRKRDWAVMDWIYGRRGKLRITHQQPREEGVED
ncbi:hypothetical protein [Sphingomonas sp. G-3-2-10]|jgi:heme exporter protein D|uniref:hypothetical protein n=1 Tax=Sphingomonas sp. G-3-2-10 TaxID=2728838 RepID=UPI00146D2904|nr:hypothetical protein [Sphingomonas sp. G-3-2-10]NML06814.1 hypothetical protein [Sphingomonas sp. G-3-2-10]